MSYGLFDQLRVDNEREFYLSLAIQEQMSDRRQNQAIKYYQQNDSERVSFKSIHKIAPIYLFIQ